MRNLVRKSCTQIMIEIQASNIITSRLCIPICAREWNWNRYLFWKDEQIGMRFVMLCTKISVSINLAILQKSAKDSENGLQCKIAKKTESLKYLSVRPSYSVFPFRYLPTVLQIAKKKFFAIQLQKFFLLFEKVL